MINIYACTFCEFKENYWKKKDCHVVKDITYGAEE